jgi:hypothetical protein
MPACVETQPGDHEKEVAFPGPDADPIVLVTGSTILPKARRRHVGAEEARISQDEGRSSGTIETTVVTPAVTTTSCIGRARDGICRRNGCMHFIRRVFRSDRLAIDQSRGFPRHVAILIAIVGPAGGEQKRESQEKERSETAEHGPGIYRIFRRKGQPDVWRGDYERKQRS